MISEPIRDTSRNTNQAVSDSDMHLTADAGHPDADGLFPGSGCPLPSRFWKVALAIDTWSPGEEEHLSSCLACRYHAEQISEAILETRPVQEPALVISVPSVAAVSRRHRAAARESWIWRGVQNVAGYFSRLSRFGFSSRAVAGGALQLEPLEDRDTPAVLAAGLTSLCASLSAHPGRVAAMASPQPRVLVESTSPDRRGSARRGDCPTLRAALALVWSDLECSAACA
jgi:hypothetical protein